MYEICYVRIVLRLVWIEDVGDVFVVAKFEEYKNYRVIFWRDY